MICVYCIQEAPTLNRPGLGPGHACGGWGGMGVWGGVG